MSYEGSLEFYRKVQMAFGVGRIYEAIETDAGRGLFVAKDAAAIVIMRKMMSDEGLHIQKSMTRIVEWWDAGKPQGAPLEVLMKKVNDPSAPAVSESRLKKEESCACCKAKNGGGKTLQFCAGCRILMYCSKECQKSDWSSHKGLCKAAQELAKST